MEAVAFIDVLGWTCIKEGGTPVETVVAGLRSEIKVALVLPGGHHDRRSVEAYQLVVLDAMRAIHANGGIIATICVAARLVTAAGLLVVKEATTHSLERGRHLHYLAEGFTFITRYVSSNTQDFLTKLSNCFGFHFSNPHVYRVGSRKRITELGVQMSGDISICCGFKPDLRQFD